MELSIKQKEIINSPYNRVAVRAAAASGKALSNDSLIFTSIGPIKIADAHVGMQIYGDDGKLHTIVGVYPQGLKDNYKVTFSDRTSIICSKDHLWTFQTESLRSKKSKTWITTTLEEIINKYPLFKDSRAKNNFSDKETKRKNIFIPLTAPINYLPKNLKIEPYTMGALLGDGSFVNSIFTSEDKDIIQWVNEGLNKINCELIYKDKYDYYINSHHLQTFSKILKEYNLWNLKSDMKFIPADYKYSCIEDRLNLLRGLIDTDGSCDGSAYDITLKSKQLILDCKEICESLGLTAVYQEKNATCFNSKNGIVDCGTVYRLRIKTSSQFEKLHRSAKREKQWKPAKIKSFRAITNIEKLDSQSEMTCIKIDSPSELFVTDNYIVTHNTTLLTEKVRSLLINGITPSTIAVITYTRMAAANLIERLGVDYKDGIYIGTVHSLAAHFLSKNGKGGMIHQAAEDEEFDTLFAECKDLNLKGEYNWVLLDEGQDSSTSQLEFIFNMLDPPNIFIVYDDRQCIFEEKNQLDKYIKKEQLYVYQMNENYRNCPSILKFAKAQLSGSKLTDNSIPMNFIPGQVWRDTYTFDLFKTIPKDDYSNWAILAPTNQDIGFLKKQLENLGIPYVTFRQSAITKAQLNKLMSENTVKLLTIHSAKGLEWDNVIVYDVNHFMMKAAWYAAALRYVGATRAKTKLYWLKK